MNTKMEAGVSAEVGIIGDGNSKLMSPLTPTVSVYSGQEVLAIWAEVAPFVQKAAEWGRGEYLAEDVLVLASEGKMQIWVFREEGKTILVCVTQIITHPRRKICNIYSLAGFRMAEMWNLFSEYGKTWLRMNGVDEIQTTCREEIFEKVQHLGFEPLVRVLRYTGKEKS